MRPVVPITGVMTVSDALSQKTRRVTDGYIIELSNDEVIIIAEQDSDYPNQSGDGA